MKREELLEIAKPILFNTEMVKTILDGRKTQTRRVVKPQPMDCTCEDCEKRDELYYSKMGGYIRCKNCKSAIYNDKLKFCYPPFTISDILYVRETFAQMKCAQCDIKCGECETNIYRNIPPLLSPNCDDGVYVYRATDSVNAISNGSVKWRPSIYMPKEAARLFLQVTDIRVERLQDIDDDGVVAEGLEIGVYFDDLWNSTIKKSDLDDYGWEANPYVWVIEFERLEADNERDIISRSDKAKRRESKYYRQTVRW